MKEWVCETCSRSVKWWIHQHRGLAGSTQAWICQDFYNGWFVVTWLSSWGQTNPLLAHMAFSLIKDWQHLKYKYMKHWLSMNKYWIHYLQSKCRTWELINRFRSTSINGDLSMVQTYKASRKLLPFWVILRIKEVDFWITITGCWILTLPYFLPGSSWINVLLNHILMRIHVGNMLETMMNSEFPNS